MFNEENGRGEASRLTAEVTRETLPNGLKLLIKENHTSPVAALLVSVRAGYFNEADPVSGIAHVIEHMIFKGTPQRPEDEQFAREIRELGGSLNAATYYEETYYYVIVPSRHLKKALEIQADALQNALFDAGELAKEIEVIVQESLQKRDNPMAMLYESLYELAYDTHRIRRWRIGHPDPLRALTRDDLTQFVRDTYRPENMIVTLVGDVDTEQAKQWITRTWGEVPRGELRREESPVEPPRETFRYRRMTGETRQRLVLWNFPAPPMLHPDAAPLVILSTILSDGRSSRLYRRLKEELQLANSAWASYEAFEQMGLFKLGAESIGDDPLPVEQALWAEVIRLKTEPVAPEELERIKTRIESSRLYAQEEVFGMARTLSSYEVLGDYHLADTFTAQLHAVTAEDVQRVAQEYLRLPGSALLEYLPAETQTSERTAEEIQAALRDSEFRQRPAATERNSQSKTRAGHESAPIHPVARDSRPEAQPPKRITLANGGTLVYKARRDLPLVSIQALFHGGRRQETRANCGLTNLMLKSSLKGTRRMTAEEIANRIEALGSGIGFSPGPDHFGYGFKVRRSHLRDAFAIFSEVLAHPAFPEAEIEREKQSIYAEIRRQQDNNFSLAYDQFMSAYYGDHPYGLPTSGIVEAVSAQEQDALQQWHERLVAPGNMTAAIVGDLEEEEAVALFSDLFPSGSNSPVREEGTPFVLAAEAPTERVLFRQKQQTAAAMGFTGASLTDPNRYALDVLDEITSAMGGRFFRAVRGENSLAYSVTSLHRSRRDAGNFIAYTSTAPENELRAREILLQECARLGREPVTEQELATAKATLYGEHVIGMQTFGAQASELAYFALNDLPLDEAERYLRRIETITAEEVLDVAARYLTPDRYWLGVVRGGAAEEA